ncbi:MAG: SpoIIE family protein phosphatase [Actinomycetota bacterium]|nr:SpoIIE family protein phosphatase [Actinomycetota bacterium]
MTGVSPSPSAELLRSLAEETPDGVVVIGPRGEVVFVNRRFRDMWRLAPDGPAAATARSIEAALQRVASPPGATWTVSVDVRRRGAAVQDELVLDDGRVLDRFGSPVHDEAGAFVGWAWYCRDVTRLRQAEAEQRALAVTLQNSLLPPTPPTVPGMDLATRYLPADASVGVGGDFYDVFRVGANDWGLVIGDVCGKGARAAALTALTRYTLRAATFHHFLPSNVLEEVSGAIAADAEPSADDRFCTLVFARLQLDTCGAWVTLSAAGHPRPIVVRRAGWIDVRGQIGTPLGMFRDAALTDDRVGLGPGDTLVFCTDGVTEARDRHGELFGDEKLPDALLDVAGKPAETVVHRIVEDAQAFAAGGTLGDDIAVLVVRVPDEAKDDPIGRLSAATGLPPDQLSLPAYRVGEPPDDLWRQRPAPPREARIQLPPEPASAAATRHFLAGLLRSWRMPKLIEGDIELLASEVVTNVIRHAASPFTVIVGYDGQRLRVEVGDGSRALPEARQPDLDDETGRGLLLMEALSEAWGVTPTVWGKRVWFEVPDDVRSG